MNKDLRERKKNVMHVKIYDICVQRKARMTVSESRMLRLSKNDHSLLVRYLLTMLTHLKAVQKTHCSRLKCFRPL